MIFLKWNYLKTNNLYYDYKYAKISTTDDYFYYFVFNIVPLTKTSVPNACTYNFFRPFYFFWSHNFRY